jgi:hypothetical protein
MLLFHTQAMEGYIRIDFLTAMTVKLYRLLRYDAI